MTKQQNSNNASKKLILNLKYRSSLIDLPNIKQEEQIISTYANHNTTGRGREYMFLNKYYITIKGK